MTNLLKLGKKAGINWGKMKTDPKEFKEGLKVEKEHKDVTGGDPVTTAKIAIAHLKEMPDYYQKLENMEKKGEKEGENSKKRREIVKNMVKSLK